MNMERKSVQYWSDRILDYLLEKRKVNPDLRFWLRQKNTKDRLNQGYWFQGDDKYIAIGLYNRTAGDLSTRSVSFKVGLSDTEISWIAIDVGFKNEKDKNVLYFYRRCLDQIQDLYEVHSKHFKCDFESSLNLYDCLDKTFDVIKPQMDQIIHELKLEEKLIIPSEKFEKWLERILNIRSNLNDLPSDHFVKHENLKSINMSLNQILYGPPGTGKTYSTIVKSLSIIEHRPVKELENEPRNKLKLRYDNYVKSGQIVFTTFHQSMSYEDFVEGIKPLEPEKDGGEVIYKVVDGLFKQIAQKAENPSNPSFEKAYSRLLKELESGDAMTVSMGKGESFDIMLSKNGYDLSVESDTYIKNITKNGLSYVSNSQQFIGVWGKYYKAFFNFLKDKYDYDPTAQAANDLNYILIIDEINRGNVSQIFGELITLIEKDKRLGASEGLTVTLPYSKKQFGVPSNLYIIGTMNTADRSVEALDSALRRRFAFKEISPQPDLLAPDKLLWFLWLKDWDYEWEDEKWLRHEKSLLSLLDGKKIDKDAYYQLDKIEWKEGFDRNVFKGVVEFHGLNMEKLLETINQRIELLLDKDHQIGHSYFFSLIGADDCGEELLSIFYDKIIPLLEEYFYGDFGKIGLILGKHFVRLKSGAEVPFADFEMDDKAIFQDKPLYTIIDYRQPEHGLSVSFLEAIKSIYVSSSSQPLLNE